MLSPTMSYVVTAASKVPGCIQPGCCESVNSISSSYCDKRSHTCYGKTSPKGGIVNHRRKSFTRRRLLYPGEEIRVMSLTSSELVEDDRAQDHLGPRHFHRFARKLLRPLNGGCRAAVKSPLEPLQDLVFV